MKMSVLLLAFAAIVLAMLMEVGRRVDRIEMNAAGFDTGVNFDEYHSAWTPARQAVQLTQTIEASKNTPDIRQKYADDQSRKYIAQAKKVARMTGKPQIIPPQRALMEDKEVEEVVFTIGLDVDYETFGPDDAAQVLQAFSQASGVPIEHLRLGAVCAGSAITEVIYWMKGKAQEVKKTIQVVYENMANSAAQATMNAVKTFMVMCGTPAAHPAAPKEVIQEQISLHAKWNRMYGPDGADWNGALSDGRVRGGKPYYCPKGWKRFSIQLANVSQEEFDAKYGKWAIAYHGTKFEFGASILFSGLIPANNVELGKGLYATPSIIYAAHPRYAEVKEIESVFRNEFGGGRFVQFALECRVDPASIVRVGPETLGVGARYKIDPNMENGVVEWVIREKSFYGFSDKRSPVVCSGIMVRVTDVDPKYLAESDWWTCAGYGTTEHRAVQILSSKLG